MLEKQLKNSALKLLYYWHHTLKPSNELIRQLANAFLADIQPSSFSAKELKSFSKAKQHKINLAQQRCNIQGVISLLKKVTFVIDDSVSFICCDRYYLIIPSNMANNDNIDVDIIIAFYESYMNPDTEIRQVCLFILNETLLAIKYKLIKREYTPIYWTIHERQTIASIIQQWSELMNANNALQEMNSNNYFFSKDDILCLYHWIDQYTDRFNYMNKIYHAYASIQDKRYILIKSETAPVKNISSAYKRIEKLLDTTECVYQFVIALNLSFGQQMKLNIDVKYQLTINPFIKDLQTTILLLQDIYEYLKLRKKRVYQIGDWSILDNFH